MNTEEEILMKIAESEKLVVMYKQQLELFKEIQKEIPDVYISWNHGCVSTFIKPDSPIFYAKSVNMNYTELSFGGLNCCHESCDNPYFARPIRVFKNERIRGTEKVMIGRYDDTHYGYDPKPGWEKETIKHFGEAAIPVIQAFLDAHPYEEDDDNEDNDNE